MKWHYNWSNALHLENLCLGAKHIGRGLHTSNRFHDHIYSELALILHADGAVHWAEGRSCVLRRGDVILMHPGNVHGYENAESLEIFNLVYEAGKLPLPILDGGEMPLFNMIIIPKLDCRESPEQPLLSLPEETLERVSGLAFELLGELECGEHGKYLRAYSLFLNLLTLICRTEDIPASKTRFGSITHALNHLNTHFRETPDIDFLARTANMSRRGFFRHFRELTGMSPLQYRHNRCLAEAKRLLLNTDKTLSEIAYECGFYDSNHFARLFKAANSISPGRWRDRSAGGD